MGRISRSLVAFVSIFFLVVALLALSWSHATLVSAGYDTRVFEMGFPTNDIIYDGVTQRIYASVPSSAGTVGNSVAAIDPATGAVESLTPIGDEPYKLALSDDGRYLYVALKGTASVQRLEIATQSLYMPISLGSDPFFGPYYVEDMVVLPGNGEAIAVSHKNLGISPRHAGVAVYEAGVQMPNATPRHTGSNVIEVSATATRLYGYNNETTEFGFRRMDIDASGVSVLDVTTGLFSGFGVDIVFDGGLIYASTGQVVDPEARTLVGRYPGIGFGSLVRPDCTVGRTFFLTGSGTTRTIQAFDQATLAFIGSIDVVGVNGTPGSLIRWGSDGLAFRTSGGQVFLVQSPLVSGQPIPTVTSTPTETPIPVPTDTPTATPTSTPTATPTPLTAHIADLDGRAESTKNTWKGSVTIAVHDRSHNPISGATVVGSWGSGCTGAASCTTGSDGQCTVTSAAVPKRNGTVSFTVNDVSQEGGVALLYTPVDNHDPDGDSNGTWIIVNKP